MEIGEPHFRKTVIPKAMTTDTDIWELSSETAGPCILAFLRVQQRPYLFTEPMCRPSHAYSKNDGQLGTTAS